MRSLRWCSAVPPGRKARPAKDMKNFKLTLEFDGTDFHGWQKQPGLRTVQGVLEDAVQHVIGVPTRVTGCCRTDAGVHAWAYVCNFHADTLLEPERIRQAVSSRLPADLVVKSAREVPEEFHARFDAVARFYQYSLTTEKTALRRNVTAYTKYRLDTDSMSAAAAYFLGKHDFSSFAASGPPEEISPICEILETRVTARDSRVLFDIKADRFLYRMVRNIMGTLMEVGRGKIAPERIPEILCKKDRTVAGPTAPACGLALMEVSYRQR